MREFLVPLGYCLFGFMGIYVLFELFNSVSRLIEAKPPFLMVVAYFLGYISPYFERLFPAALMLAALYTMWNFCRHSEITAMRASGIGFIAIVRPLLSVAAVATVAVALLNEFYAPYASEWAFGLRETHFQPVTGIVKENVLYYNLPAGRQWRVTRMNLDNPNVLEGVRLSFDRPDGSRHLDITCRTAEYLDGVWWLSYPHYRYFDELNSPIEDPYPALTSLSIRAFPEFDETPRDFLLMNKHWQYYTTRDMVHYLQTHPSVDGSDRIARRYDIGARLFAPLSCLVITLFAIPAGVVTGRQSVFWGVIAAVAMFFGFYATDILCMALAKRMWLPVPVAVVLPNLVFLTVGLVLFYRQR
ncbi:MAG: LptF/LptG family permease [Kiritimatiellaeota bacterium]|nr:LptF/LptG family permease [Kiritimatiellota bacterium]